MLWKQLKNVPRECLNWHLYKGVLLFGLMGTARGYNEGAIAGSITQPAFQEQFGLNHPQKSPTDIANTKANIVSMAQLGSIAGAVLASTLSQRLGPLHCLRLLCWLWLIGIIIEITTFGGVNQLYAGRLIAGTGIGMTSIVCPSYIAEVAPAEIRGFCACFYSGSVYFGIMFGYLLNLITTSTVSQASRNQWVLPACVEIVFAAFGIVSSFYVVASPRWLLNVGRTEDAVRCLEKLRGSAGNDAYVTAEISTIVETRCRDKESWIPTTKKIKALLIGSKYQLLLCLAIQILGQWSGANALTLYAPDFFAMVSITGHRKRLLATSMLGLTKLVASVAGALFIIDYLGRKKALYVGISLQMVSIFYVTAFLEIEHAGQQQTQAADTAAVAALYVNGIGWAIGWNSIQYLINAEIFPQNLRALASGIIMAFHFANQFANARVVPVFLVTTHNWGAMLFFGCICLCGLVFTWFFVPELSGVSLEAVGDAFAAPWYQVGRHNSKSIKIVPL